MAMLVVADWPRQCCEFNHRPRFPAPILQLTMRTRKWTVNQGAIGGSGRNNEEQEGREKRKGGEKWKTPASTAKKNGCGFGEARRHRASSFAPERAEQPCFPCGEGGGGHSTAEVFVISGGSIGQRRGMLEDHPISRPLM